MCIYIYIYRERDMYYSLIPYEVRRSRACRRASFGKHFEHTMSRARKKVVLVKVVS